MRIRGMSAAVGKTKVRAPTVANFIKEAFLSENSGDPLPAGRLRAEGRLSSDSSSRAASAPSRQRVSSTRASRGPLAQPEIHQGSQSEFVSEDSGNEVRDGDDDGDDALAEERFLWRLAKMSL